MSWNLWPSTTPELPRPEDVPPDPDHTGGVDLLDDAVQVLEPETEPPGCWHVRPVPPAETPRPSPALRHEPELRRHRPAEAPERVDLRGIGLPDHLVPPKGGIFALLTQLERMPPPRLPSLRPGDEVAVVILQGSEAHRGGSDPAAVGAEVRRALVGQGAELGDEQLHVFEWPVDDDPVTARRTESALVEQVRSLRARLEFIAVHPDCAATVAYAACRAMPGAQLYLTGVLGAQRPAAPLGWGAPVAFVDGRPASPAVLAAVLADRLAGGVS